MSRVRLAALLAGLAGLALVVTGAVAVTRSGGDDPAPADPPADAVVVDPSTGATLSVPLAGWEVRGPRARIYYADAEGRPVVAVRGPAVFRAGYCAAAPRGSSRAFVGFTRQSFAEWAAAIGGLVSQSRDHGIRYATLRPAGGGACSASAVELAMRSGPVRAVLVADVGEPGTLTHRQVVEILATLDLP